MKREFVAVSAVFILASLSGCASAPVSGSSRVARAEATIRDAAGEEKGRAELWQDRDNVVHVDVVLSGLPPGPAGGRWRSPRAR